MSVLKAKRNYDDHGRVLRLQRLCYALFGDLKKAKEITLQRLQLPASGAIPLGVR